jgi:hypothetical protein
MSVVTASASWWGYAEGNPIAVGVVVVLVAAAAIGYVVSRRRGRR